MISRLRKFGTYGVNGLGDSVTDSIAAAITRMEGTIPPNAQYPNGSLAYQNNNPGNIRYVQGGYNYPGATQGAGGFARYPDVATGQAALQHQIQVQIGSGQNLTQFFNQYAPSSENNTQGYISMVAGQTGIDPNVPLINYQNGTVSAGVNNPSDSFDSTTYPTDGGMSTNPASVPATSLTDTLNNMDPVTVGAVGIGIAGILYVLFG